MSTEFLSPRQDLKQAFEQCKLPTALACCLPPECYTEDEFFEWERNELFRNNWIGIGREDRVSENDGYTTFELVGVPIILVRDSQGHLRAFNNTCRHRGARLLDGEGNCKLIRCPFHSWAYGPDGNLVSAPELEQTADFNYAEFNLVQFPLKCHAGFLFVCLSPTPPPFDVFIGDFDRLHTHWPLKSLTTTRRKKFLFDCNWKAFLDVFNEYYHLRFVHPDSINDLYRNPDPGDQTTGAFASQFGATDGTGALLQTQQSQALPKIPNLDESVAQGARYTWLFPNMTFAAGSDSSWVYEAYPLGANKCLVYQSICFPDSTIQEIDFNEKSSFYYDRLDAALEEDRVALENQHQGLKSPFARAGRFQPLLEPNVAEFANWYATQI